MARNGILIDYEFCTGCKTCEMACKVEHSFPRGKNGVILAEVGPWKLDSGKWQNSIVPIPTDLCDLCEDRVKAGKEPTCVHHCQAAVMKFGPVEELAREMAAKPKTVLFAPR
jgi:Fe-S-cluster-containing dehydrogenase component